MAVSLSRPEPGAAARILIVDDSPGIVSHLKQILEVAGYTAVRSTTDPRRAMPLVREFEPDLILLDLHMPHLDGFAVLQQLGHVVPHEAYLPVLMLTADISAETKQRALAVGAKDFLTKPFSAVEAILRIRNLLETRSLYLQLRRQNHLLEDRVRERTLKLENAQMEILQHLALAAEYRDDATGQHTQRVGKLSAAVATTLGLPAWQVEVIGRAAPLHDVGKIGVPDGILLKRGPLCMDERTRMMEHPTIGAEILTASEFEVLQMAEQIARSHHERWDGGGYPLGLRQDECPLEARIVAIADTFDALTHERPYKRSWPVDAALAEVRRLRGTAFEPAIVDAFMASAVGDVMSATVCE